MDNREEHKGKKAEKGNEPLERFRGGTIPWKVSMDEAWKEVEGRTVKGGVSKPGGTVSVKLRMGLWHYSAAAVIIILFGLTSFMRFYSRSYSTDQGENMVVTLPDGSVASLNAATKVKYNPLWWNISRSITLEGEAFFEVEKGEEFEVLSSPGSTMVLGTSFNVLARNDIYEVTCITGKVKVVAGSSGDEAILNPSHKAVLGASGELLVDTEADISASTAWRRGEFIFTSVPLEKVFSEIELRYGATINYKAKDDLNYTGYFKGDNDIEKVLELVCIPFGIKFEKASEGVYRIIQDE